MLQRLLTLRALARLADNQATFKEMYFSATRLDQSAANRQRARRFLLFLAQLRIQSAIDLLQRFEGADFALNELRQQKGGRRLVARLRGDA